MSECRICHGKGIHKVVSSEDYKTLTQSKEYKEGNKEIKQTLFAAKAKPEVCHKTARKINKQLKEIDGKVEE